VELISPEYLEQNRLLHKRLTYGAGGDQYMDLIEKLVIRNGPINGVLDYGAGKGNFKRRFERRFPFLSVQNYDPVTFPDDPLPADLLVCTDVLEHIEPECLGSVLNHMKILTRKLGFLVIATRPAQKNLPDGRNAHLIQKPSDWWLKRIEALWNVSQWEPSREEIIAIVYPR